MNYTNIGINVRPIKIAFLVNYNDKLNLQKAMTINSVLWGGLYNPIIPVYNKMPSKYSGLNGYMSKKPLEIIEGYIECFDPDYIVNLSSIADAKLPITANRLLKESDIFDRSVSRTKARGRGEVNYGTGIFEILDYTVEKEFKYERKEPVTVKDIQFGKRHGLFFGSVFGNFSDNVRNSFTKRYKNTIGIKSETVSLSNYFDVLEKSTLTVRGLCNSYFDVYGNAGPHGDHIFLLDINSWQDIVDYNNLVAVGFNVLAIPLQLYDNKSAVNLSKQFVEQNYRQYNDNMVFYSTTVLKSRDCPEDKYMEFSKSIHIPPKKPGQFMASNQTWFPRMWDSWAQSRDGVTGLRLEHKNSTHEISGTNDIKIPPLVPDFIEDSFSWWKPKYANELTISSFGDDDFLANVFPANIERADMVLGRPAMDEWRFSKRGIVYLPTHIRSRISFELPSADKVYTAWQETLKIDAHTSNPGKLARQIVKKLGVNQLTLLSYEGFAQMLRNLTDAKGLVQSISYDEMWARIQEFTNNTIWFTADNYFKWLLHKGIFELGTSIKCDNCNRESWHALNNLNPKVICTVCLEEVDLGLTEPKKQIKWAYRPVGAFSVPDLAQGAYTVVLALHFFTEVLNMKITPRYSFESNDGAYEADFGALLSPNIRDESTIVQLLGECKSFGKKGKSQFKDSELTKLFKLAQKSNNSVLVFATLSRELSEPDKRKLKKLVVRLRNLRFNGKESIDLLVLTGNELFSQRSLKETWGKLGSSYTTFVDKADYLGIRDLCDVTQQIYLGLPGYWDEFKKKQESMAKKATSSKSQEAV